jgi:type IV secretion/conjugal transfer VirB4 family ATPase
MALKWWQPLPKQRHIEDILPIVGLAHNDTLVLKNGHLAAVYQLAGKDYTGADETALASLHKLRNDAIRNMPHNVVITIHSRRVKEIDRSSQSSHNVETADEINQRWSSRFKFSYRNKHYLALTTTNGDILDELAALQNFGRNKALRAETILEEAARDLKSRLSDYRPHRLSGGDLCSFIASYLNGKPCYQKSVDFFNDLLTGADIVFPELKPYQIFEGSSIRYAAWLSIKYYEDNTTSKMIDEIMKQQIELTLYAQSQTISADKAFSILDDKRRTAQSWLRYSDENEAEFAELYSRIENKDISLCYFAFALQIFGDTLEELNARVEALTAIVEYYGYRVIRETQNQEPLYWSMLPSLDRLMVRKRYISSENTADIVSYATIGEGFERCSWGDSPVTRFLTAANTEYRFCFHNSEDDRALGHTLVFGSSNSGKTTLVNFLLSQSLRFKDLRIILFDRQRGQRVFAETHDATYSDLGADTPLNPFLLPDTSINRAFLSQMIGDMAGLDEPNPAIEFAIDLIFRNLKPDERSLNNALSAFSPSSETEFNLTTALKSYSGSGKYAHYFNAKKDGLDFKSSRIATFNVDLIIDDSKILGLLLNYIFHRIRLISMSSATNDPKPHIIFADELPKLLESEAFAKRVKETVLEARKLDGVFIGAAQTPQAITDHPIGKSILSSFANFIFFPDALADEKTLKNDFQLSETEIAWIKTSGEFRKILFKRNGGESVILNVDLSPLGEYLRCFQSGNNAVKRVSDLKKANPTTWKKEFLCAS